VTEMDRHLRELLNAAVGEPPHQVSAEAVRRRVIRRRVVEFAAVAAAVAVMAVIVPVGIGALGRAPAPSTGSHAVARVFTSRQYGYTEALPAGWRSIGQARQRWDGKGAPADTASVSDLFQGPGRVEAWAYAAPTKENLAAYTTTTIHAAAAHSCPAVPQTDQAITIGGAPARLLRMQCPPRSGFLVEIAVTIHHGTAFVFASQNRTGTAATDPAAFRKFLAGVRLQQP
jgi:hypothetical protein